MVTLVTVTVFSVTQRRNNLFLVISPIFEQKSFI